MCRLDRKGFAAVGVVALLAALAGRPAVAATLAPEDARLFPAGSRFLAGIDVHRLMNSALYERVLKEAREKSKGGADPLEDLRQKTGLDPARDIDLVLFAGEGGGGDPQGVALVTGRFEPARLGAYLAKQKDVKVQPLGARKLYLSPGSTGKPATAVVVLDARRLLVGQRPAVERALAAGSPGLDPASALVGLAGRVRPGAALWVVADERLLAEASGAKEGEGKEGGSAPGGFKLPPLKSLVFSADIDPELVLDLVGETADEGAARNLADMLRGLTAMLAMQASQKPELAQLQQALTVESDGTRVSVGLKLPYDVLQGLVKSAAPSVAPAAAKENAEPR